ncbi:MAG: CRISPR-associated protein [Deltaproteobacteria bacterium]|nr:CRISPR-associated protein [Deltaproteobacteria bacterium]
MQAGVWRATSPVIPHSAAWGMVLNFAALETRGDSSGVTTLVNPEAPPLCIVVGSGPDHAGVVGSLYQQLHTYPVGDSGKALAKGTHGAKYWIAPTRRELLVDMDCIIGVRGTDSVVLDRVVKGLRGELAGDRYGLPFAGDNNLLLDRVDVVPEPPPTRWYEPLAPDAPARQGSCRLTVAIDRNDSSRTVTRLYAPTGPQQVPPESAWTWTPHSPAAA